MTLVFHPLAERELIAAARFYETRASGLGHPNAGSLFMGMGTTIRRRLMQRFPFGVVYEVETENISVIAIMHLRRRPGYWKRRLRAGSSARR